MEKGDQLGHENRERSSRSAAVSTLKVGDRVVVPFTIRRGECFFCQKGLFACCDPDEPQRGDGEAAMGQSPAGLFGFST